MMNDGEEKVAPAPEPEDGLFSVGAPLGSPSDTVSRENSSSESVQNPGPTTVDHVSRSTDSREEGMAGANALSVGCGQRLGRFRLERLVARFFDLGGFLPESQAHKQNRSNQKD